jgi:acyl dehydratase
MLDPTLIGTMFPAVNYEISRAKIRELARALGDPNPIYHDLAAAQAAGYPDLPLPPTFATLFGFWPSESLLDRLIELGVELRQVLHTEEEYEYLAAIYAGETVTGVTTITNLRSRREMEFINLTTNYTNQRAEPVLIAHTTMLVRLSV